MIYESFQSSEGILVFIIHQSNELYWVLPITFHTLSVPRHRMQVLGDSICVCFGLYPLQCIIWAVIVRNSVLIDLWGPTGLSNLPDPLQPSKILDEAPVSGLKNNLGLHSTFGIFESNSLRVIMILLSFFIPALQKNLSNIWSPLILLFSGMCIL